MVSKVILISAEGESSITIHTEVKEELDSFLDDIEKVFISDSEFNEKLGLSFKRYGLKNKIEIEKFIKIYENKLPRLKALRTVFSDLETNEKYVCMIRHKVLSKKDLKDMKTILRSSRKSYVKTQKGLKSILGDIMLLYEVHTVGYCRQIIGTRDIKERVCRFCGKGNKETTFKNKAHAISEALGNRKAIILDECDNCNKHFGETIENDIIAYFSFLRTIYGVKGKGGLKKLKGHNFKALLEGRTAKLILDDKSKNSNWLKLAKPIVYENVYRSICKYFLSIVDKKQLKYFKKTTQWVMGRDSENQLPVVAESLLENVDTEPKIAYYLRKNDDNKLPHAVIEFVLARRMIILIIPFSSKDNKSFAKKEDYDHYWKTFKHHQTKNDWNFVDFSKMIDDDLYMQYTKKR